MVKNKLLSGRVKVTPSANVTADRYQFLGLEQAEPNLGVAPADGYVLIYDSNAPGQRNWSSSSLLSSGLTAQSAYDAANTAEIYANGAFVVANSASIYANGSFVTANSAASYANGAFITANSAASYANASFETANSAGVYANAAFAAANTADQRAVTSGSYANSAYIHANAAYAAANNKLDLTGGTITGDLSIAGNLTVSGNTIQIDVTTLNVTDPIIYLAANNYDSDVVGIGFVGNYNDGAANRHAGLIRMEGSNTFYLFTNYDEEFDTNTLDLTNASLYQAELRANVTANTVTVRNVEVLTQANAAFSSANTADQRAVTSGTYANSAYLHANAAYDAANNAVDTWVRDAANSASSYANSSYIHANAAFNAANNAVDTWVRDAANSASSYANGAFAAANTASTSGSYANAAYNQANTATLLAQAAFDSANNAEGSVGILAYEHANAAFDTANTALGAQELYVASLDNFTSNGQNTIFTLSVTPANVNQMFVYVDGVYQQASAYTLTGNTITLSEALDANSILEVRVLANTTPSQLFPTAFNTTVDTFSGDNSTTEFTLSTTPIDENHTFVFLNGVYQEKSTYSISGANVVLTGTATSNDTIEVATVKGSEINVTSSQYNSRVFTGDSACTEFTIASGHSANSILVFENGICQEPITDYTVSGTTLTFTTAPGTGVKIQIRELPV